MKMLKSCMLLIFLWCFVSACQLTQGSAVQSSWDRLQEAKSLSCKDWPVNQNELQINELYPADLISNSGFFVNGRARDGAYFNYFVPIQGRGVTHRKKTNLEWGFGTEYLGTIAVEGEALVLLEVILPSGKRRVELRTLDSNVVRYQSAERNADFRSQQFIADRSGFWLAYKQFKENEGTEDLPFHFVRFEWQENKELRVVASPRFTVVGDLALVTGPGDRIIGVYLDTGTSSQQKKPSFQHFALDKSQSQVRARPLALDISERIESWSIAHNDAGIVMAYVSGDTLLWENASLEIVRLDENANILQKNSFEIVHEHVGDPLLVAAGGAIYLFMSKWLDAESTVSVYRISTSNIEDRGVYGVFPEGTYLHKVYYAMGSQTVFLMNQSPTGLTRRHSYCTFRI